MKPNNFFLIAGPCVVESKDICFEIAEKITTIAKQFSIDIIFKASFKKANRTSLNSFIGIGDEAAIDILNQVKLKYNIPVLTDIHETTDIEKVKNIDIIQIPAMLSRQTDLLIAAAKTGKIINLKKSQTMPANAMQFAIEKIQSTGNNNIWLTERGTQFGYNDLIVDFRNIAIMQQYNLPVIMDCTHATQQPYKDGKSGGQPQFIETYAKCAMALGVNGLFIETHPNPKNALSDGSSMLLLDKLEDLLEKCLQNY